MNATATLEREVRSIQQEVHGIRSLLMEIVDPDFGLELREPVKARIRRARKDGQYVSLESAIEELRK
ncbi:MAG: hypothetical protein WCI17_08505 [bacterium]